MPKDIQSLHKGKFLELKKDGNWEYVTRHNCNGAVVIIALSPKGELILVSQFRPPVNAQVLEWPAGLIGDDGDADESPLIAGQRELMEECGCTSNKWTSLISGPASAGLSDENMHFVLAENCERVAAGGGIDGEDIQVHFIARAKLQDFLRDWQAQGHLVDVKIFAGLYLADEVLPKKI